MKKRIIVLGAGLVGNAMAIDLNSQFYVTSVDINQEALDKLKNEHGISILNRDLSNPEVIKTIVADFDLVIGAVPGFMGFETVKAVIKAGKDIVDISFFAEDPFELDELAKKHNWYIMTIEGKDTWEQDYLCNECYDNLLMKFLDEK